MLDEINELRLLYINESEMEKQLKKVIFLFISLIIPVLEIIILILQEVYIYENEEIRDIFKLISGVCSLISLFCTWGMMNICYYNYKCIVNLIIIKTIIIFIFLNICYYTSIFYYFLVFNIIGYGIFYTLIIVYKAFKKGII